MKLCLGKANFIVMGIAALVILVGFILMCGEPSTPEHFNPDVFAPRRWAVAGNVCFIGYLLMIVGILIQGKKEKKSDDVD